MNRRRLLTYAAPMLVFASLSCGPAGTDVPKPDPKPDPDSLECVLPYNPAVEYAEKIGLTGFTGIEDFGNLCNNKGTTLEEVLTVPRLPDDIAPALVTKDYLDWLNDSLREGSLTPEQVQTFINRFKTNGAGYSDELFNSKEFVAIMNKRGEKSFSAYDVRVMRSFVVTPHGKADFGNINRPHYIDGSDDFDPSKVLRSYIPALAGKVEFVEISPEYPEGLKFGPTLSAYGMSNGNDKACDENVEYKNFPSSTLGVDLRILMEHGWEATKGANPFPDRARITFVGEYIGEGVDHELGYILEGLISSTLLLMHNPGGSLGTYADISKQPVPVTFNMSHMTVTPQHPARSVGDIVERDEQLNPLNMYYANLVDVEGELLPTRDNGLDFRLRFPVFMNIYGAPLEIPDRPTREVQVDLYFNPVPYNMGGDLVSPYEHMLKIKEEFPHLVGEHLVVAGINGMVYLPGFVEVSDGDGVNPNARKFRVYDNSHKSPCNWKFNGITHDIDYKPEEPLNPYP